MGGSGTDGGKGARAVRDLAETRGRRTPDFLLMASLLQLLFKTSSPLQVVITSIASDERA
jgi:hypothetical protein